MAGFVDTFNEEISKRPKEEQDRIMDATVKGFKNAGCPHLSLKALMATRRDPNIDLIKCENCEKHFLESELDLSAPCPNCGE